MARYVVRRLAYLVPIWLLISFFAFLLAGLAPGDPAEVIVRRGSDQAPSAADVARVRHELHLDDPFPVRFGRWVLGAATGDLGRSYRTGERVLPALAGRFVVTAELALPALLLGFLLAVPIGVVSAVWRNSLVDHVARVGSLVGASLPSFWLGYMLVLLFAVRYQLFPVAGRGGWRHLVLPAATLALGAGASLARLTRASLLDTLGEDYVRTARAKGLRERTVVVVHGLRNSLIPVVTVAGIRFGHLLAGAVVVETVFAWPGMGKYVVDSIYDRDYPVIQGFVLFTGTVFVLVNLLVDLLYVRIDPRVRIGTEAGA
jgi:peptide/nickel transport system permease protein